MYYLWDIATDTEIVVISIFPGPSSVMRNKTFDCILRIRQLVKNSTKLEMYKTLHNNFVPKTKNSPNEKDWGLYQLGN